MDIIIAGGTGFIGNALAKFLINDNHKVTVLTRNPDKGILHGVKYKKWSCNKGDINKWKKYINGSDVVVNLAGDSVSKGRWNPAKKEAIFKSRVKCTAAIVEAIKLSVDRPKVLINGSAIGYYGPRGNEEIDERDKPGTDFMSNVCIKWENEALKASEFGVRVAVLRTGIVLGSGGGALERIVQPFKMGLGGKMGSGQQWMSWICMEDLIRMILFIIKNNKAEGPFNGTAPHSIRNKQFVDILGKILNKKPIFSIPSFVLRIMIGKEFADTVILGGQKVVPKRAADFGFQFKHTDLKKVLESILKQNPQ